MNLVAEVTQALSNRDTTIPAPYVRKHGRFNADQENVDKVYDIFIRLDGKGDHFKDAKGWGQAKVTDTPDPRFYFFQVLVLMMETHTFGAMRPIATLQSEPRAYWQTVALAIFQIMDPKPANAKLLTELMRTDNMFDKSFSNHIKMAMEDYKPFMVANKPKKGRKPAAAPAPAPAALDWSVYQSARILIDNSREIVEGLHLCENMWWSIVQRNKQNVQSADENEKGVKFTDFTKFLVEKYESIDATQIIYPKCTFTVTSIPNVRKEIVGMYVRFLVRDVDFNPGVFYEKILENLSKRMQRRASKYQNPNNGEMFPDYRRFGETSHPAGNNASHETYINAAIRLNSNLKCNDSFQTFKEMALSDLRNPFHLCKLLTPEQAMDDMQSMLGIPEKLTGFRWWDERTKTASFPVDAETYVYHPDGVFWYSERHIGLHSQWFPHVETRSDLLTAILSGRKIDRFITDDGSDNDEDDDEGGTCFHEETAAFINDNWIVPRAKIANTTLAPYRTYCEFVHLAFEAERYYERVEQEYPTHAEMTFRHVAALGKEWRKMAPETMERKIDLQSVDKDLLELKYGKQENYRSLLKLCGADEKLDERVKQYERYSRLVKRVQEACNDKFVSLWQVDGNVDALPIPGPIKVMLKWYRSKQAQLPHMTRQFVLHDPDMGIFGNSCFKMVTLMADMGKLLQPMMTLLVEALCTAYRWAPDQLAVNLIIGGAMGGGKSLHCINFPKEHFFIPNTTTAFTSETKAASTTQKHSYDEIQLMDETPEAFVSEWEAKKNPDIVNQEKVKLSSRRLGKMCYVQVALENGESARWAQMINTDHFVAKLTITNSMLKEKTALLTRYHQVIMAKTDMSANKMEGKVNAELASQAQLYFHIAHFLCAGSWKCIQAGGMFEPNMNIFNDISNRVIEILHHERAIERSFIERKLEIMRAYGMQCTIRYAIHCAYDIPGGENYEKPFDASTICNIQPYMYCTTEITIWVWTTLISGFIEEKKSTVLTAAVKALGLNWDSTGDPYNYYEADLANAIPWRQQLNLDRKEDAEDDGDDVLINLNYITLEGTMEQICRRIASHCNLDHIDVAGVLHVLSKHQMEIPGGAYIPQEKATFASWHKYLNPELNVKNTDAAKANMPQKYFGPGGESTAFRTREHVPKYPIGTKMPVVDDVDMKSHNKLYIMPFVADMFRSQKVLDALRDAIMCSSTKSGKFLIGIPSENISMQLKTMRFNKADIEKHVVSADEKLGWDRNGNWTLDESVPMNERPVPLSKGIGCVRQGIISKAASSIYTDAPLVPTRKEDWAAWKASTERAVASMSCPRDIYRNLDEQAALQQHLRIGRALDDDVLSPEFILNRMKEKCTEGMVYSGKADYPHTFISEYLENTTTWTSTERSLYVSSEIGRSMQEDYRVTNEAKDAATREKIGKRMREIKDARKVSAAVFVAPNNSTKRANKKPRAKKADAKKKSSNAARAISNL